MTDLCISTPTQADYNALMRLAEVAGYEWYSKHKPTNLNCYAKQGETVIRLDSVNRKIFLCRQRGLKDKTIEMIPDLSSTIAVYEISQDSWDAFSDEYGSYKWRSKQRVSDRMPHSDQYVVLHEQNKIYSAYQPKYSALAVDYKPKESEDMSGKVKLPKFMCTWLTQFDSKFPLSNIAKINEKRLKDSTGHEIYQWLNSNETNQWKLIDALRYGYEPEPGPRWGVKAGHSYLYEPNDKSFGPDEEPFSYSSRYDADQVIVKLGFGKVVNLNDEGD